MSKFKGKYPPDWELIAASVKADHYWKCERCGHPDDPNNGFALTVHHLDNNKSNVQRWNLASLCQKCHLHIQGKVELSQFFMWPHSDWMIPHVIGYYKSVGIDISNTV